MSPRSAAGATAVGVALTWALAIAPAPALLRAAAGFAAVLLLPGLLLDRALGRQTAPILSLAARALALSMGMIGAIVACAAALGMPMSGLLTVLAAVTALLIVPAARMPVPTPLDTRAYEQRGDVGEAPHEAAGKYARIGVLALTIAGVVLAAWAVNVARDRMWYAAYIAHLAGGAPIDWREPMLGSGQIVWRFAHNAWILAFGAWSAASGVIAPLLLERVAPPLLFLLVPGAAGVLCRSLLGDRNRTAIAVLCCIVVLLATSFPYFATERTAFFARLAEDKTAALVLLAPVALGLAIDAMVGGMRARDTLRLVVVFTGAALSHGIVYLVMCIALAAFVAWRMLGGELRTADERRRAITVLALAAAVAVVPALLGWQARGDALRERATATSALLESATDPIVRAHLRMERLRELPAGGPIVEPTLLADPLLLLALIGLLPALRRRRSLAGAFACASALAFLALAFVPFVSPAFGRVVVPWMAYRALWGVPFGLLLGMLVISFLAAVRRHRPQLERPAALAVLAALAATGVFALPWERLRTDPASHVAGPSEAARRLLTAISHLPDGSLIAAAPSLAELIPAYGNRPVLALADRGTVVFARSRERAEQRLLANAVLLGLRPRDPAQRAALLVRHGVTHVVVEGAACEPGDRTLHADGGLSLCEPPAAGDAGNAASANEPARDGTSTGEVVGDGLRAGADSGGEPAIVVAALGREIHCTPPPRMEQGLFSWRRASRWAASYPRADCTVQLAAPHAITGVRIGAHLPRADERLLVRAQAFSMGSPCADADGDLALRGDAQAQLALACANATEVTLRLVPAYLPYLNVRSLEIIGASKSTPNAPKPQPPG